MNENGTFDDGTTDRYVAAYQYDGLGRRIAKMTPNLSTSSHWDRTDYYYNESWQVLEERRQVFENLGTDGTSGGARGTVAANAYAQYIWDLRYIDAPVLRWRDSDWETDENHTLDETMYYCNDANMNVTALIDGTSGSPTEGQVVERYLYDAYGSVTFCDSAWTPTQVFGYFDHPVSMYDNEILYCGYRFDPETGLYLARRRYYQPTIGRWTTRDPIGYADRMNLYECVASDPPRYVDPLGLDKVDFEKELRALVKHKDLEGMKIKGDTEKTCDAENKGTKAEAVITYRRKIGESPDIYSSDGALSITSKLTTYRQCRVELAFLCGCSKNSPAWTKYGRQPQDIKSVLLRQRIDVSTDTTYSVGDDAMDRIQLMQDRALNADKLVAILVTVVNPGAGGMEAIGAGLTQLEDIPENLQSWATQKEGGGIIDNSKYKYYITADKPDDPAMARKECIGD